MANRFAGIFDQPETQDANRFAGMFPTPRGIPQPRKVESAIMDTDAPPQNRFAGAFDTKAPDVPRGTSRIPAPRTPTQPAKTEPYNGPELVAPPTKPIGLGEAMKEWFSGADIGKDTPGTGIQTLSPFVMREYRLTRAEAERRQRDGDYTGSLAQYDDDMVIRYALGHAPTKGQESSERRMAENIIKAEDEEFLTDATSFERDLEERGTSFAGQKWAGFVTRGILGALRMPQYAAQIAMGPLGVSLEGSTRLRERKLKSDITGESETESFLKAAGGAIASYVIEQGGAKVAAKAVGGVAKKALSKLPTGISSRFNDAISAIGKLGRKINKIGAVEASNKISKAVGLGSLPEEILEEYEEGIANAIMNIDNDGGSLGDRVVKAIADTTSQVPEMAISLGLPIGARSLRNHATGLIQRNNKDAAIAEYQTQRATASEGARQAQEQVGAEFDAATYMDQEDNRIRSEIQNEFGVDPEEAMQEQEAELMAPPIDFSQGTPPLDLRGLRTASPEETAAYEAEQAAQGIIPGVDPAVSEQAAADREAGEVISQDIDLENAALLDAVGKGTVAPEQLIPEFEAPPIVEPVATVKPIEDILGITVEVAEQEGGARGGTVLDDGTVRISPDIPENERSLLLLHEWLHKDGRDLELYKKIKKSLSSDAVDFLREQMEQLLGGVAGSPSKVQLDALRNAGLGELVDEVSKEHLQREVAAHIFGSFLGHDAVIARVAELTGLTPAQVRELLGVGEMLPNTIDNAISNSTILIVENQTEIINEVAEVVAGIVKGEIKKSAQTEAQVQLSTIIETPNMKMTEVNDAALAAGLTFEEVWPQYQNAYNKSSTAQRNEAAKIGVKDPSLTLDVLQTQVSERQNEVADKRLADEAAAKQRSLKAKRKRTSKAEGTPETLRQRIFYEYGGIKKGNETPSDFRDMHRDQSDRAFDQIAQDFADDGTLPDGYSSTLEDALKGERIASRRKPQPSEDAFYENQRLAAEEAETGRQTANLEAIKTDEDTQTIDEATLTEDSLVRKNGQWYKVADMPFGTTLEDGTDIEVSGSTEAAGVLFKGEQGYDEAKAEYDAQIKAEAAGEVKPAEKPKPKARVPAPRKPKAPAGELFESETTTRTPVKGETKKAQVPQEYLLGGLAKSTAEGKAERAQGQIDLESPAVEEKATEVEKEPWKMTRSEAANASRDAVESDPTIPKAPPPAFDVLDAFRRQANRSFYNPDVMTDTAAVQLLKDEGFLTNAPKHPKITPDGRSQLNEWDSMAEERRLDLGNKMDIAVDNALDQHKDDVQQARNQGKDVPAAVLADYPDLTAKPSPKKARVPAPRKAKAAPTQEIKDFGEKIGGARKDYAAIMTKAKTLDIATQPLSKVWPEPNYQKLLDSGLDPWAVGFIRAARDEIPAKPRRSYLVPDFVKGVELLRSLAENVADGTYTKEKVQEMLDRPQFTSLKDAVGSRAELYAELGQDKSLKGVKLTKDHFSLYHGEKNVTKWMVTKKAKATAFSNWPQELGVGNTKEEALDAFRRTYALMQDKPAGDKKTKFTTYTYRTKDKPGVFIGKKMGKNYVDLYKFETQKEASDFLKNNYDDIAARLESFKKIGQERRSKNSPRVGADHRNGKDVTPAMFQDGFGFRGVEFGNYVEQGRRQTDLNNAYDAMMDLAGILNIPSQAISLNGELGLAFGARGKGGKNAAAAHYEPSKVVINLTKRSGPGSLAHEWWHAVDYYFSKQAGNTGEPFTEALLAKLASRGSNYQLQGNIREDMVKAFGTLVKTTEESGMPKRSKLLDMRRSKPYWSKTREMTARAFENYVIERLAGQNASNDYLANISDISEFADTMIDSFFNEGTTGKDLYPYLTQDEVQPFTDAFDNFFATVKTKETDKGTAMFMLTDEASPYYSPLTVAITGLKQAKGTPAQFKAMIAKLPGVKAQEMEESGFNDWLDGKTELGESVTKAEAQAFMEQNGVQVQEVELSERNTQEVDFVQRGNVWEEKFFELAIVKVDETTYRLQDLTDPNPSASPEYSSLDAAMSDARDVVKERKQSRQYKPTKHGDGNLVLPGGENYTELVLSVPGLEAFGDSTHFSDVSDGTAVAWVRFNERTTADGRKMLFVEELQSQRHQAGRKRGYAGESNLPPGWSVEQIGDEWIAFDINGQSYGQNSPTRATAISAALSNPSYNKGELAVPDAPFKGSAWKKLAMRRMIKYAADNGFDSIGWTTGSMQNDRYDLSKQIESITYGPDNSLVAYDKEGNSVIGRTVPESELEDTIGKEAATKLLAQKENSDGERFLNNQDLKVGGEGMKGFYDRELPNITKDVARKMDKKARLGSSEIVTVEKRTGPEESRVFDTDEQAAAYREGNQATETIHSLEITDKMRTSAAKGIPQYMLDKQQSPTLQGETDAKDKTKTEVSGRAPTDSVEGRSINNGDPRRERGFTAVSERFNGPRSSDQARQAWQDAEIDEDATTSEEWSELDRKTSALGYTLVPVKGIPTIAGFNDPDSQVVVVNTQASRPIIKANMHELFHVLDNQNNPTAEYIKSTVNMKSPAAKQYKAILLSQPGMVEHFNAAARQVIGQNSRMPASRGAIEAAIDQLIAAEIAGNVFAEVDTHFGVSMRSAIPASELAAVDAAIEHINAGLSSEAMQAVGNTGPPAFLAEDQRTTDAEYMKAVEAKDTDKQQEMVDAAAKAAGLRKAFHGTPDESLQSFAASKYNDAEFSTEQQSDENTQSQGIYVSTDYDVASGYATNGKVFSLYVRMGNPFVGDVADFYKEIAESALGDFNEARNTTYESWKEAFRVESDIDNLIEEEFGEIDQDYGVQSRAVIRLFSDMRTVDPSWITYDMKQKDYDSQDDSQDSADKQIILFNPSQIKSADPITYDDNGKPIPLSQRFEKTNPDIRFMLEDDPELKGKTKKQKVRVVSAFLEDVQKDIDAKKKKDEVERDFKAREDFARGRRMERPAELYKRVPQSRLLQNSVDAKRRQERMVGLVQTIEQHQAKIKALQVKGATQERTAKARKKARQDRVTLKEALQTFQSIQDSLPREIRGKLKGVSAIPGKVKDETKSKYLLERIDQATKLLSDHDRRQSVKRIKQMLAPSKIATLKTESDEIKQDINDISKVVAMKADEYANAMAQFTEVDAIPDDQMDEFIKLATFGNLSEQPLDVVLHAEKEITGLINGQKLKYKIRLEEYLQRMYEWVDKARGEFSPEGRELSGTERSKINKTRMALINALTWDGTFEGKLDKAARFYKADEIYGSPVTRKIIDSFRMSDQAEAEALISNMETAWNGFDKIFGTKRSTRRKQALKNSKRVRNSGVFINMKSSITGEINRRSEKIAELGDKDTPATKRATRKILDQIKNLKKQEAVASEHEEMMMSKNEAYHMWQGWQDTEVRERMEKHGWTQNTIDQIETFAGPKVIEWAQWQMDEIYNNDDRFDALDRKYRDVFFVGLGKVDNYSPRFYIYQKEGEQGKASIDMAEAKGQTGNYQSGRITARVKHNRAPKPMDGDLVLMGYFAETEHFKAWGQAIKEARSILNNRDVQQIIDDFSGEKLRRSINGEINDAAAGYSTKAIKIGWMDKIRGNIAISKIALPGIAPSTKQLVSMPAFAGFIGVGPALWHTSYFMLHPKEAVKTAKKMLANPLMKARGRDGYEQNMSEGLQPTVLGMKSLLKSITSGLILPTRINDKSAIVMGGLASYRHYQQKAASGQAGQEAKDNPEKYAMLRFLNDAHRAQQSARQMDLPDRNRMGSFANLFTTWKSSQSQYQRIINDATRNLVHHRGNTAQNLRLIVMFHLVLPVLFQAVSNLMSGGDPWPEDEDDLIQGLPDSILRAAILGNANSWVILGDYVTAFTQGLIEGKAWGSTGTIPILEPSKSAGYVGAKLRGAVDDTRDMTWADWDRLVAKLLDAATGLPFERTVRQLKRIDLGPTPQPSRIPTPRRSTSNMPKPRKSSAYGNMKTIPMNRMPKPRTSSVRRQ